LVGLGVEVVRQVFGLGPADFVDDFGLRSRGGCLAQAGGTRSWVRGAAYGLCRHDDGGFAVIRCADVACGL
jgi:hypothetical protein